MMRYIKKHKMYLDDFMHSILQVMGRNSDFSSPKLILLRVRKQNPNKDGIFSHPSCCRVYHSTILTAHVLAVKGGIWIPRLHPGLLKGVWNLISTMTEDRTSWIRLLGRHVESGMSKAAYLKWSHFLNNPMLQVCHTIELSCKLQCCWMWVPWQWLAWTFTRVMCPSIRIAWIQVCTNI